MQQRVIAKIDPGNDVCRAKRHLLGLGKEIIGISIQDHPANLDHRNQLLGNELGGVQHIEAEGVRLFLRESLQAQFPLWINSGLNGVP